MNHKPQTSEHRYFNTRSSLGSGLAALEHEDGAARDLVHLDGTREVVVPIEDGGDLEGALLVDEVLELAARGDGYQTALTNFGFLANAVVSTQEAVSLLGR